MSVIFETCGFLFCQKHPLGFGMHVEMKGCMQHVARVCEEGQDFPCFSTPPLRRHLEACVDHQRCQLQTQRNYNLRDDDACF